MKKTREKKCQQESVTTDRTQMGHFVSKFYDSRTDQNQINQEENHKKIFSKMDSSLSEIIVRIKQASNDVGVKRRRLEHMKKLSKKMIQKIEVEKLKAKEMEENLKKSKVELIEAKSHQIVHDLVEKPAVDATLDEYQQRILPNLKQKVDFAKLRVKNYRQECFDCNARYIEEAPKKEKLILKDIKEKTEINEKKLDILKAKKDEFTKIEMKKKKYETSIKKTTTLNELMKEKITDTEQDVKELKVEVQTWKTQYANAQESLRNIDFKLNQLARNRQNSSSNQRMQNFSSQPHSASGDQIELKSKVQEPNTTDFVPASSLLDGQPKFKFRKLK